jgi:hypothetical protein
MNNLEYKGFKSTRMALTLLGIFLATAELSMGNVTGSEWLDALKWLLGIYASSEAAAKGAEAVRDRGVM